MFDTIFAHFDTIFGAMLWFVGITFLSVVALIGLIVIAFPFMAAFAVKERRERHRSQRRASFARQRMLQQVVQEVAVSNQTPAAPPVRDYPAPVETAAPATDIAASNDDDAPAIDDYPDPEE